MRSYQNRLPLGSPCNGERPEQGSTKGLRVVTWNVRNPSLARAEAQANWLQGQAADVLMLTELKQTAAADLHQEALEQRGYQVVLADEMYGDYGVLVAVRDRDVQPVDLGLGYLPHRAVAVSFESPFGPLTVVGLYVPSRGPVEKRNIAKRRFQVEAAERIGHLAERVVGGLLVGGDLNVVERGHVPSHAVFGEWEYRFYESFLGIGLRDAFRAIHPGLHDHSWFGRSGNGYRFDHIFVSPSLAGRISHCGYNHATRHEGLSDHSGMEAALVDA